MKAHLCRSDSRRPAFFNISVQKKNFLPRDQKLGTVSDTERATYYHLGKTISFLECLPPLSDLEIPAKRRCVVKKCVAKRMCVLRLTLTNC